MFEIDEEDYLAHYGTPRHSGRYPWGSGGEEDGSGPRNASFLDYVDGMKKEGLTEVEIAKGLGITTTQLRVQKSIEKNSAKQDQVNQAQRLKDKGYSNVAIGERMKLNESSVRALLVPGQKDKLDVLHSTADMLRDQVAKKELIDVGTGVEQHLAGVSRDKLNASIALLQNEGYKIHYVKVPQLGTNKETTLKVLGPPGMTYSEVFKKRYEVQQITEFSEDGGHTFDKIHPPVSISSKRVAIKYAEQGGTDADGVIYVRPGVDDISLGASRYAQVRIAVDGSHYLKGMAMYKDDLPPGVDLMFNTNKSTTGNKLDAMKEMAKTPDGKIDLENPFGASIHRQHGSMNILREEGQWETWSRNLPSQFLSKQSPSFAKNQLDLAYLSKKEELDEIKALSNPTVRKKLLETFASSADASAVHLKAAALPRQSSHVILPIASMKATEIYAPRYRNGEKVALVRFPHGGTFEIPVLTVNNRQPEAKKLLGDVQDAVGISAKVAERLSGADFDGDTVLVLPNDSGLVKSSPALEGLKKFDPKASYPKYPGMPEMTPDQKAFQMGDVSNLITDMTIKGANTTELARAVRHSMTVIDAEKHKLDWRASARDNGIKQLKAKYQGGANKGASTLISRASSEARPNERKDRAAAEGGPIDRATGKRVYTETGASYVNKAGQTVNKTTKSTQLAEAADANALSSGTTIEKVYAGHSNRLKDLADQARLAQINTPNLKYDDQAKKIYAKEVTSLNSKLNIAISNRPLERQAQVVANATLAQKRQANPNMDAADLKREKSKALIAARIRTGALKQRIEITQAEWNAIQAGAITNNKLSQILNNTDLDKVKALATPKTTIKMTTVKTQRAQVMLNAGYTQAEVADALGVSLTTLKTAIGGE